MNNKILLTLMFITVLLTRVFADQKGADIARKSYGLKESTDQQSVGTMVLLNDRGDKKIRKFNLFSKKRDDGTSTFIEFLDPADVSGTKFLTIGHDKGDDDQRLYLPALGKIRKIASSGKDGSFMGSDLSYYDMEDRQFEDNDYQFVKEDEWNGKTYCLVEAVSKDKDSPYSRVVQWISKEDYFVYRTDCYDKKDREVLLKKIIMVEVTTLDGIIIPVKMAVDNIQKEHKTLLQFDNIRVNTGLKDTVFSVQNLEK